MSGKKPTCLCGTCLRCRKRALRQRLFGIRRNGFSSYEEALKHYEESYERGHKVLMWPPIEESIRTLDIKFPHLKGVGIERREAVS